MTRSKNEGIRLVATFDDQAIPLTQAAGANGSARRNSLFIYFKPGMPPRERQAIETDLTTALANLGQVTGGGGAVDLSESDISISVVDMQRGLQIIREVLKRLNVAESTVIVEEAASRIEHRVYE